MRDLNITNNHMKCKRSDSLDKKATPSPMLLLRKRNYIRNQRKISGKPKYLEAK